MKIDPKKVFLLMAKLGLTRGKLCGLAGISTATFTNAMQRGSCRIATAGKIASALGIDPAEIIA